MSLMMGRLILGAVIIACLSIIFAPIVNADPSSSTNLKLDETVVGGSGLSFSESANFQSSTSVGALGIDNSASTNLQVYAGNKTTGDPSLTFSITDSTASFSPFSVGSASTATSTFEVINYTSYGYVVQLVGNPPTKGTHTITAMASTAPSQVGIEQFGINLVANTSPASFGSNPDQGQFGFGVAASNYATANNFRYVNGESIVTAPKSSGKTIYTISYIVNVSTVTPAGSYTTDQTLICTGTY
jgi:hypothetical protein